MSPYTRRCFVVLAMAAAVQSSLADSETTQDDSPPRACIAVVMPSAHGVSGDAAAFSESLQQLLVSYLSGPTLRTMTPEARLASQAIEEARQSDCNHVLIASVTRKRNSSGWFGKVVSQAAPAAAYAVPYGSSVTGAAMHGVAVGGAYAISSMAEDSKAKDQVTFEYRIGTAADVMKAKPQQASAKAQSDGEDVLTPLIASAAESIAATVLAQ